MQSKIRVYESGRTEQVCDASERYQHAVYISQDDKEIIKKQFFNLILWFFQEYDPDLPPELAAAAGHDISENRNMGKTDLQNDLAKGSARGRMQLVWINNIF